MMRRLAMTAAFIAALTIGAGGLFTAANLLPAALASTAAEDDRRAGFVLRDGDEYAVMQSGCAGSGDVETGPGVLVAGVVTDGAADSAGIVRGDILLEVDGTQVDTPHEIQEALSGREPGDEIELSVRHGDELRTLSAVLGDCDSQPYLGLIAHGARAIRAIDGIRERLPVRERLAGRYPPLVVIKEVVPDGPADRAGVQDGDIILELDGKRLTSQLDLIEQVEAKSPGEPVELTVRQHEGEERRVTLQLEEHPDKEGTGYMGVLVGSPLSIVISASDNGEGDGPIRLPHMAFPLLTGSELIEELEGDLTGLAVLRVVDESAADKAGLQVGDVITAIDGSEVTEEEALSAAVDSREPGDPLDLTVLRPGEKEPLTITVLLDEHPADSGSAFAGLVYRYLEVTAKDGAERRVTLRSPGDGQSEGVIQIFESEGNIIEVLEEVPEVLGSIPQAIAEIIPGKTTVRKLRPDETRELMFDLDVSSAFGLDVEL